MGSPLGTPSAAFADDELAKFAAEGNTVAVDGECFIKNALWRRRLAMTELSERTVLAM